MSTIVTLLLPAQAALESRVEGQPILQLRCAPFRVEGTVSRWQRRGVEGALVQTAGARRFLLVPRRITPPSGETDLLLCEQGVLDAILGGAAEIDAGRGRWLLPSRNALPADLAALHALREDVRQSWAGQFRFRSEQRDESGAVLRSGLRPPQVGALHALLAHWTVTRTEPATIVMPTGTGKTETMLGLLVAAQPECVLIVVPTDALREQVAAKVSTLGLLSEMGVVGGAALLPVVAKLKSRPRTPEEVHAVFRCCNVVVTTMAIAGGSTSEVQRAMADAVSHLIIDEAHHVTALTWSAFRQNFDSRAVVQFTATPFRRDRKHVDGRVIYNYPLRKAQEDGLFRPINFHSLLEYDPDTADLAMAMAAFETLDRDRSEGLDHIVMARAHSIERATQLGVVYESIDQERAAKGSPTYGVILVHSDLTARQRATARAHLDTRRARILVCVDMFGEGFDMPELKIAVLHDMHRSLAITLQFTGRFTRARRDLGDATMIANVAGARVEESLRALYAEDADWNVALRDLSAGATGRQARFAKLLSGFPVAPGAIPLQNVLPKMSTVVYRMSTDTWYPERIAEFIGEERLHGDVAINPTERVAVVVTRDQKEVEWGDVRELSNVEWNVFLAYWDESQGLLFVHSSDTGGLHKELAEVIGGEGVELVAGEAMFRGFHETRRLVLMNLGLRHSVGRNVQFTMYVGADILAQLSGAQQANKIKSNMFGRGYVDGERSSYGCSYKGRAWSYQRAGSIGEWMEWCRSIGAKLTDDSISTDIALKYVIVPTRVTERPVGVPLAVLWPDELLERPQDLVSFRFGSHTALLLDTSIEVVAADESAPIRFCLRSDVASAEYDVHFSESGVTYAPVGASTVEVVMGRRSRSLAEFFRENPPLIHLSSGAFLLNDALFQLSSEHSPPFDRHRIEVLDWVGVDLRKESQGVAKRRDSIQRYVIEWLLGQQSAETFDIVFDDDSSGEAADIVAIRRESFGRLFVLFVHCKFSQRAAPGERVKDLYEVCGQAQRSVTWRSDPDRLLEHLDRREAKRIREGNPSRFERGDVSLLRTIRREAREWNVRMDVMIVQPGVKASEASASQLELLAVTEAYLMESAMRLRVVGSA